jgi:hypothetical protein
MNIRMHSPLCRQATSFRNRDVAPVSAQGRARLSRRPSAGLTAPNTHACSLTVCAGAAGLGAQHLLGPLILPIPASSWNMTRSGLRLFSASARAFATASA